MNLRFLISMLVLFLIFSIGAIFIACQGVDNFRQPITQAEDGIQYAKYMHYGQDCIRDNLVVFDCFDACNCCHFGRTHDEARAVCIRDCDTDMLNGQNNADPNKANYDLFRECTVGCFADCSVARPLDECWDACKKYLE